MKKFLVLSIAMMMSFSSFAVSVGKVNIQEILLSVNDAEKAKGELQQMAERLQKQLQEEEAKIQKMQEDYQKQHLVLSDAKKAEREREIQMAIMAIQERSQEFQRQMQQKEDELKEPILERIRVIVEEVSKAEEVDLTFEVSIAPVIYVKSGKNLTPRVIELYNQRHK